MGLFGSSRPPHHSEVRSKSYRVFRPRQWASLERGAGCPSWVKLGSRTGRRRLPLYPSKQTSGGRVGMSVQCQQRKSVASLDHFVCSGDDLLRNRETERLGGLEVYCKLELRGCLNRKVPRLRAFEDAVDIAGRICELGGRIDTIGQQTALFHIEGAPVDRGQPLALRRGYEAGTMDQKERLRRHDEAAVRSARDRCDFSIDLAFASNERLVRFDAEIARGPLDRAPPLRRRGIRRVLEHRDSFRLGRNGL